MPDSSVLDLCVGADAEAGIPFNFPSSSHRRLKARKAPSGAFRFIGEFVWSESGGHVLMQDLTPFPETPFPDAVDLRG